MDSFIFLLFITLVIHAVYGLGVLRRTRKMVRHQMEQYEKRLHAMAHSLYTPLGSIRNFTELLGSEKMQNDKERMAEYTDIIDENVVRMLETLRYYIDVSRLENNTFDIFIRDYSFAMIVEERLHFYGSRAMKASVILSMDVAKNVPAKTAFDARAVSHMIDNMLSTTIERSRAGDTIDVHVFGVREGQTIEEAGESTGQKCTFGNKTEKFSREMVALAVATSRKIFDEGEVKTIYSDAIDDLRTIDTKEFTAGQLLHSHHVGLTVVSRWAEAHGGSAGIFSCATGSVLYFTLPQTWTGTEELQKPA